MVKVIRPGLKPMIAQDLAWLFILARAAEKLSADARLLHPVDVVQDYEKTIYDELDLLREAANASQLEAQLRGVRRCCTYHKSIGTGAGRKCW